MSDITEHGKTPEFWDAQRCEYKKCPPVDTFCVGFGLAGGGYGPYTWCPLCKEIRSKTRYQEDET